MMKKKYKIILADPPWSIQTTSQVPSGRPNTRPYTAMRQVEIYNLPVKDISDKDCLLFLWATSPLIPEALFTMKSWGFEFKNIAFTWIKKNKKADSLFWGMGWWTRSNPEFLLLGTKGTIKRQSAKIHSVVESIIEGHSKKPDIIRDKIVELCGDLPRIELFAREKTNDWDVWGNEVESDIDFVNELKLRNWGERKMNEQELKDIENKEAMELSRDISNILNEDKEDGINPYSQHPRIKPDRGGESKPCVAGDKLDNGSSADINQDDCVQARQDVPEEKE